jgi:hypothetical protein
MKENELLYPIDVRRFGPKCVGFMTDSLARLIR